MTADIVGLGLIGGSFAKTYHKVCELCQPIAHEYGFTFVIENKDNIINELDHFLATLHEARDAIDSEDYEGLKQILEEGRHRKEEIDGKQYTLC